MKKLLIILTFFCSTLIVKAQNLIVEGTAPNVYIIHTVAPKENFYSIGRLYSEPAKSIAAFNNLVMDKGLTIGQRIKIPLNIQHLNAEGNTSGVEMLVPLSHVVVKGETIATISSNFHVPLKSIKQWNNVAAESITPGTALVVGHLKIASKTAIAKTTDAPRLNTKAAAVKKEAITEQPNNEQPATVIQTPTVKSKETTVAVDQEKPNPTETLADKTVKDAKKKEPELKQEAIQETSVKQEALQNHSYSASNNIGSIEGVFANVFTADGAQKSVNNKSGEAATFKSTSGWQDKKYYVLMNDVLPGTILKIASTENKVVYAKVLGSMPEMKENNGLLMRISNAAASYLGIIDPKFPVQITYYQ